MIKKHYFRLKKEKLIEIEFLRLRLKKECMSFIINVIGKRVSYNDRLPE